ncbi:MAG: hypothetical protein IT532_00170 [Burkholderiales bacterium]|nr:hypothetical protein [Burkholderiales bacterium]
MSDTLTKGRSMPDRILRHLAAHPKERFFDTDLQVVLGIDSRPSIAGALTVLARMHRVSRGKVERPGQAACWVYWHRVAQGVPDMEELQPLRLAPRVRRPGSEQADGIPSLQGAAASAQSARALAPIGSVAYGAPGAAQIGETTEQAAVETAPASAPAPAREDAAFRCALFSDGELEIRTHGVLLTLTPSETRQLLRYLERIAVEVDA